jgi:exonuclease VII small subunit
MKSKSIPPDIKSKSIKEAQNEIKDIISNLENAETDLKQSINQYNRMIQLNHYIQEKFKEKLVEIKNSELTKTNKSKK